MNTITVKVNKNNWLLELEGIQEGLRVRKRYRNRSNIKKIIDELDSPNTVFIGREDMKLFYADRTVVLKNYAKNKNRYLYKLVTKKINAETKILRVLLSNAEKISKVSEKVKSLINIKSVMALAISVALVNTIPNPNLDAKDSPIVEIFDIDIPMAQSPTDEFVVPWEYVEEPKVENVEQIENLDLEECMKLDNRLNEFEEIQFSENRGKFDVGSRLTQYALNKMVSFIDSNGQIFIDAGLKYGVDPYLLLAMSMNECTLAHYETIPGGSRYNGSAYGAMQIETVHIGSTVTAYNHEINDYETVSITREKLMDLKSNVEIGAMMMQNNLAKYNNNVYISIQSHNYGTPTMDRLISLYANEVGKTFDEVTLDLNDLGWMKYVDDMHFNPQKYLSYWQYGTYGGNEYISNVLSYYIGHDIINSSSENRYIFDLVTNTCELQQINKVEQTKVR